MRGGGVSKGEEAVQWCWKCIFYRQEWVLRAQHPGGPCPYSHLKLDKDQTNSVRRLVRKASKQGKKGSKQGKK